MSTRSRVGALCFGVLLALAVATAVARAGRQAATCPPPRVAAGSPSAVEQALSAGRDIWGEALIRSAAGPTFAGVQHRLSPLLLVGRPAGTKGTRLTDSGAYYLAFGQPATDGGEASAALHVADGSEIRSGRADGPRLAVYADGAERYGSCRSRLRSPTLADGYLPILETGYTTARGLRLEQESFATRVPAIDSLVSFVRLQVDARRLRGAPARIRFESSGRAVLLHGPGGATIPHGRLTTLYVAWLHRPAHVGAFRLDERAYLDARASVAAYWNRRLLEGAQIVVPEQRVMDAERNLLIQNLTMGWRYSLGNDYQAFEFPESLDGAGVMAGYGFYGAARATLETALTRRLAFYPNWDMGEQLLTAAAYYALSRDQGFLDRATPVLARYVAALAAQPARDAHGLLRRERYASDLPTSAYGLNNQAVVWQGLRAIAWAWTQSGQHALALRASTLARPLGARLRAAVRSSSTTLRDGSVFVPVRLFGGEAPYDSLTSSKAGSYWNLVMPYALASGLIPPGTPTAKGLLRYLLGHGSRILGLVRFNYYPAPPGQTRPGGLPGYRSSGTDQVYGLHVARFLAANDQPDQLVLSLYGQLGAAMTARTYVSGEGATLTPAPGEAYRSMYLPPNSVGNAAFLETLRLMLVHETTDASGKPSGLELGYATPRDWLRAGKSIRVQRAPTSFGLLSFSIEATQRALRVSVEVPERTPNHLSIRLRLPHGKHLGRIHVSSGASSHVDRATGTIDLSGSSGTVTLLADYR